VPDRPRLQRHDVEQLDRSLAAGSLPVPEQQRLVTEARRLLEERARVIEVVGRLAEPWADVRAVLNELHRVLDEPRPPR
jgi:hypothetical protein